MEATIQPRDGTTEDDLEGYLELTPMTAPDLWLTRREAADHIGVGDRTVDRYIRRGMLTTYWGPVPMGGVGVRVLRSEVDNWSALDVRVVVPDAD